MLRLDLHTHTTASDGSLTPTQLIQSAARRGLSVIAVTDHDTIDGLEEAIRAGEDYGIGVIPGVELSVDHGSGSFHLLGYGFDHRSDLLKGTLARIRQGRYDRNRRIIAKLNQLGFRIDWEQVAAIAGDGTLGRGHIARMLVVSGQMGSTDEVFAKLLGRGGAAYVDRYRLSLKEACELLHSLGGISVWAHPGLHKDLEELLLQLPKWHDLGLDGMEADYSQHSIPLRNRLRNIALKYGMIYTGGSDFHGELKPAINVGDGPGKGMIDERILRMLEAKGVRLRLLYA